VVLGEAFRWSAMYTSSLEIVDETEFARMIDMVRDWGARLDQCPHQAI